MKKLILGLLIMITMFITGCDNNSGPFETKRENGVSILYSNNKLAKGWLTNTVQDRSGNSVTISEIYFDKGLPAGDFTLRNLEGHIIAEAKGKWIAANTFEGTIKNHYSDETSEGTYYINSNFLLEFNQYLKFPIDLLLFTGEYNDNKYYKQIVKKNNIIIQETSFYKNKQIKEKNIYDNTGKIIEQITFYENGQMKYSLKNTDTSRTEFRTEDGEIIKIHEAHGGNVIEYYSVISVDGEIIPHNYQYNKNGKEIKIKIDPYKEYGRGIEIYEIFGFTGEELEKQLPEKIIKYIKKAIELGEI